MVQRSDPWCCLRCKPLTCLSVEVGGPERAILKTSRTEREENNATDLMPVLFESGPRQFLKAFLESTVKHG